MHESRWLKYSWLIIPLIFLLFSAPGALDYIFHFPDEKYYTDAVLQMMDKHEWFTPFKADGSPRFLKPILTYWVLIGSYQLFGVSTFSSRLFFWLAGALLVMITWFLTKSVTGNKRTAATAAFITAANPLVLMSASRSIPDILLVLFLTISAWGFIEIMIQENPAKRYYWFAYMGAALAFETKGIPAAAFAGLSMLFIVLNPWKRKKIKQLFEPISLTVSILVALSWFIIMYMQHGSEYLASFYSDQVGGRVSSRMTQILENTLLGMINLIAFTIPWIIIAFTKTSRVISFFKDSDSKTKAIVSFIAVWIVLIILMAGAVFRFYDRYLLPVIPLISVLFALIINNVQVKGTKASLTTFIILNLFVLVLNLLYAAFIVPDAILIAGILISALVFIFWYKFRLKNMYREAAIALFILLLYFNLFTLLNPLLMPNPGEQIVKSMEQEGLDEDDTVYVYGNIRTASNIRIQGHNRYQVLSMDTLYIVPSGRNHFLVYTSKEEPQLNLNNYQVSIGGQEWNGVPVNSFPEVLQPLISKVKENGTRWYIAKPNSK